MDHESNNYYIIPNKQISVKQKRKFENGSKHQRFCPCHNLNCRHFVNYEYEYGNKNYLKTPCNRDDSYMYKNQKLIYCNPHKVFPEYSNRFDRIIIDRIKHKNKNILKSFVMYMIILLIKIPLRIFNHYIKLMKLVQFV